MTGEELWDYLQNYADGENDDDDDDHDVWWQKLYPVAPHDARVYQIPQGSLGTMNPYFEKWIYFVPYNNDAHVQLFDLHLQQRPIGWITVGRTRQYRTRRTRAALQKEIDSKYTKILSAVISKMVIR